MSENGRSEALTWKRGAFGEPAEDNGPTIRAVKHMIKAQQRAALIAQLTAWSPEDVMDLLVQIPLKRARKLFQWLPAGPSGKVLAELRPEFRAVITEDATVDRLRQILDRMPPEEASETLEALPDEVQEKLLPQLGAAEEIAGRRRHGRDTAGRIMTRRFVALTEDCTAGEAIAEIRAHADIIRKLDDVFAIDGDRRLVGVLNAKRLLLVAPETRLGDIMRRDFVVASADMDQEEVGRLAARGALRAVPVVNQAGQLIGQVTVRQLKQIMRDEAAEDLLHMSNVSADAKSTDPIKRIVTGRLPWLLAGLIGASIAAMVVGSYEEELEQAAILAAFIPVVLSLAGNSGLQASAVTVQALATGTVWTGDLASRFFKELAGSLINGAVAGAILAALILIASQVFAINDPVRLALATSLSLLTVTTIAALVGAFVPMALDRIGIDPAMATGVFITTSNDVLGVFVFFLMATGFYFH